MFWRHFSTQHGGRRSGRLCWRRDEYPDQHSLPIAKTLIECSRGKMRRRKPVTQEFSIFSSDSSFFRFGFSRTFVKRVNSNEPGGRLGYFVSLATSFHSAIIGLSNRRGLKLSLSARDEKSGDISPCRTRYTYWGLDDWRFIFKQYFLWQIALDRHLQR